MATDTRKVPSAWRIVNHGPDHAQYFQGHGVAFTKWQACATGGGQTPAEALDDALEQLADEWQIASIEADPDAVALANDETSAHEGCENIQSEDHESCEFYWYISIDVREG